MIPHVHRLSTISARLPAYYALTAGNARPCTCKRTRLTHCASIRLLSSDSSPPFLLCSQFLLLIFLFFFSPFPFSIHAEKFKRSFSFYAIFQIILNISYRGRSLRKKEIESFQCWKVAYDLEPCRRCGLQ